MRAAAWGAAHAFGELGAEDGGDPEAARALDHVDEALSGLGDGGELVHDQQHLLWAWFAADCPLGELLDQEAGEIAGLVLEAEPVEEEVGAVDLVERGVAVEGAGDGGEEGGVAGADPVQLFFAERGDLGERERALRMEREERVLSEPNEEVGGAAGRTCRGVAGETDGVDREVAVVGAAALVGEVDQLQ